MRMFLRLSNVTKRPGLGRCLPRFSSGSFAKSVRHAMGLSLALAIGVGSGVVAVATQGKKSERELTNELMVDLQHYFTEKLQSLSVEDEKIEFSQVEWKGRDGGGTRYEIADSPVFNRASINESHISSADSSKPAIASFSVIIHPQNPYAPSMHCHVSRVQTKKETTWRLIADLNPSIPDEAQTSEFESKIGEVLSDEVLEIAKENGDNYFMIPVLGCKRGVSNFFLVTDGSDDPTVNRDRAEQLMKSALDAYVSIVQTALEEHPTVSEEDRATQLRYHTIYTYQVLLRDAGTVAGLKNNRDNDLGILSSLPSYIDRDMFASLPVQNAHSELAQKFLDAFSRSSPCAVDDATRSKLADIIAKTHNSNLAKAPATKPWP